MRLQAQIQPCSISGLNKVHLPLHIYGKRQQRQSKINANRVMLKRTLFKKAVSVLVTGACKKLNLLLFCKSLSKI